ncbi:MAG TPA: tRNA lysidine(34) synthetase TilS [Syntrophales bacterium]|nr:tRNA lysidine(34) synthetase TilS [Syntrophales bacterium]
MKKLRQAVEDGRLLERGDKVIVAVSGGPDSIALLLGLKMLSPEYGLTLIAAHMNHGLRKDAADEEEFVGRVAADMAVGFECRRVDVALLRQGTGRCLEDIGREARYAFLADVAALHGAQKIALAHHMNDQVETVLMNFIRGSGPGGLKGMRPARDSIYIRPLLGATRSEITAFLDEHQMPFMTDSSNMDQRYLRNRIRHSLIPELTKKYNPGLTEAVIGMADIMAAEDDYMQRETSMALARCGSRSNEGEIRIGVAAFGRYHESIQRRILKRIFEDLSPDGKGIGFDHVKAALGLMNSEHPGASINLPRGIEVRREYADLVVCRCRIVRGRLAEGYTSLYYDVTPPCRIEMSELGKSMRFDFVGPPRNVKSSEPTTIFMDYDKLSLPLFIRFGKPGDRIQPMGMKGTKKIMALLIDEKVPVRKRKSIPLLLDQKSVLWIAGLRLSERAKITEKTRQILRVEFV